MIEAVDTKYGKYLKYAVKIVAVFLLVLFFVQDPLNIFGRVIAAERVEYLKEIKIYETDTMEEARSKCESEGYIFVGTDLNSGTEKNYVYMGYKTTYNRDEAICDIKLLDMNGGFQIKDFAQLNDEFRKQNYDTAETLQMATIEFIDSYNNKSPKALDAYEGLNLLSIPEAGDMKLGDYIVSGKTDADFYARVITQASTGAVSSIVNFLYAGLAPYEPGEDYSKENIGNFDVWATQMSDSVLWDVVGTSYISADEAAELDRNYGDDARALFKQMQEFATGYENGLANYEKTQKQLNDDKDKKLQDIVDDMDNMEAEDTGSVYLDAYELLNRYDANPDMPLGQWIVEIGSMTMEEVDLTQIYPMIDSMSYAQVRMTELTGFVQCASTLGTNEHSEEYEEILSTARAKLKKLIGNESVPIWSTNDMENAKVAFTSDAIRQSAAQSLLNDYADETDDYDVFEDVLKWTGLVSSALTVVSFVLGKYFIGGLLLYVGKVAACATLTTIASAMCTFFSYVCTAAGIIGLIVLGVTLLYLGITALIDYFKKNAPRNYETIPDYVIDSLKTDGGYSSVKYKAVGNNGVNRSEISVDTALAYISGNKNSLSNQGYGDLNGHQGHTGWVVMYTTTDERAGSPIRADSNGTIFSVFYGNSNKPYDCDCVSFFGQITPGNCNTNAEEDGVGGIYINYYSERSLKNRNPVPNKQDTGTGEKTDNKKDGQKETKYYYSELIVKTGTREDVAKAKITVKEQYIWDQNLSPGARTLWEEDGQYTYLGYKITTDPKQAVTDIRVATFNSGGQVRFGDIGYGCAGPIGFPASSKEENKDYPDNLDGLYYTTNPKAGTPIEVGKLHLVNSFSQAQPGWEPVTTFSGAPYNFATTRYDSRGLAAGKPGRWHSYPFQYTGYCTDEDNTWNETDAYLYYEPEETYTSGDVKYLSGMFFTFGTDSISTGAFANEVCSNFSEFTGKIKTFQNTTVLDGTNLAQSFQYKGYWVESEQKYLYLCYTWSYNPYRALYDISLYQGNINSSTLPYNITKALSYPTTESAPADKSEGFVSSSVLVQRSAVHHYVLRAISPENAFMTATGLLGDNDQVAYGYSEERYGFFGDKGNKYRAWLPTGLYVSGPVANKQPLTLDDVIITSNAHTAVEVNGYLKADVSNEKTLGGKTANGEFSSVQDLKAPAVATPYNLSYPSWTSDEMDKFDAGTPVYIYYKHSVPVKKYISRIFVGQCSRAKANSSDEDTLEAYDKLVDMYALAEATAAATDEVIPVNAAADYGKAWYDITDGLRTSLTPAENQPAAYIGVARTDKEEEAIRGILLYKGSPDQAVPNMLKVSGASYYCASNTSPIRMSNGSSYYLYYTYNIGVSSGGPITSLNISSAPLLSGMVTALVTDRGDTADSKAVLTGDTTLKTFIHAKYEVPGAVYFNKIYAATGKDEKEAKLNLLAQGCTEYLDIDLNVSTYGNSVYLGYRTFTINEMAITMLPTREAKAAERASQMSQAIYDIVCTVGEEFHPEGFMSQKYQIYYAPVLWVDPANKNSAKGVDLNDGTGYGPKIYLYYATPYAANEYNKRVIDDPRARLSQMPDIYYESPITKLCLARYDRVPYNETVEASTAEQDRDKLKRWEYIMAANSKDHVDLNDGAIKFDSDGYALDNRITMFAQREDGSCKPGAEITGGFLDERDNRGYMIINR